MNGPVVLLLVIAVALSILVVFEYMHRSLDALSERKEEKKWLASRESISQKYSRNWK